MSNAKSTWKVQCQVSMPCPMQRQHATSNAKSAGVRREDSRACPLRLCEALPRPHAYARSRRCKPLRLSFLELLPFPLLVLLSPSTLNPLLPSTLNPPPFSFLGWSFLSPCFAPCSSPSNISSPSVLLLLGGGQEKKVERTHCPARRMRAR
jgi:hypothetical protein